MHKWIIFSAGFPAKNPKERLRAWRRLAGLGAVSLKTGMWVLPMRPQQAEGISWLTSEVEAHGGDAVWIESEHIGGIDDNQIIELFRKARSADYEALSHDIETALAQLVRDQMQKDPELPQKLAEAKVALRRFNRRLDSIASLDFFPDASQTLAQKSLEAFACRIEPKIEGYRGASCDPGDFQSMTWITRQRPEVDRLASAWLISRFIDRAPTFAFVAAEHKPNVAQGTVYYDMPNARFTHQGELVTAEVLAAQFSLNDPKIARICRLVHQVDLLEDAPDAGAGEVSLLRMMLQGLHALHEDDQDLLRAGLALFDALYAGLSHQHKDTSA